MSSAIRPPVRTFDGGAESVGQPSPQDLVEISTVVEGSSTVLRQPERFCHPGGSGVVGITQMSDACSSIVITSTRKATNTSTTIDVSWAT